MSFTDSVPAIGNQIANDLIAMEADFAWLKTAMSNFVGAWSDSVSTGIFPGKFAVTTVTAVGPTAMAAGDTIVVLSAASNNVDYRLTAVGSATNRIALIIAKDTTNTVLITNSGGTTFQELTVNNQAVLLACDGSTWYKVSHYWPNAAAIVRDSYRNLSVVNSDNTTVDVTADELVLGTTTGIMYKATSVNVTADIEVAGNGGLDTGAEATSTWYHVWVIYNGTTVSTILSASSTAPTMPTGYKYKAYVGAVWNNASSNFWNFVQDDRRVYYNQPPHNLDGSLTAGAWTSFDLTDYAPPTAKRVHLIFGGGGATNTSLGVASNSTGYLDGSLFTFGSASATQDFDAHDANLSWITASVRYAATAYYWCTITTGDMYINGWEY